MFELTSQEKKTIVFILSLLLLGIGLDFFRKKLRKENLFEYETLKEYLFKKVDVNKANLAELRTIPEVSEKLAKAIIDYRKSKGKFENLDELKQVKGIKEKKLAQLRKYIILSHNTKNK